MGVWPVTCDRKQVSRGICADGGDAGLVVVGEGGGLVNFGFHHGWVGGQAPA